MELREMIIKIGNKSGLTLGFQALTLVEINIILILYQIWIRNDTVAIMFHRAIQCREMSDECKKQKI